MTMGHFGGISAPYHGINMPPVIWMHGLAMYADWWSAGWDTAALRPFPWRVWCIIMMKMIQSCPLSWASMALSWHIPTCHRSDGCYCVYYRFACSESSYVGTMVINLGDRVHAISCNDVDRWWRACWPWLFCQRTTALTRRVPPGDRPNECIDTPCWLPVNSLGCGSTRIIKIDNIINTWS